LLENTFFTPSYSPDLDRLVLLRESIRRFYQGSANHVIAVPSREIAHFLKYLKDDKVIFVSQESMVSPRFYPTLWYRALEKILPDQCWRFQASSGRSGWIIQQIVKLCAAEVVDTQAVTIVDSDFVFMRPFSDEDLFGNDASLRSLYRVEPNSESGKQRELMRRAREILSVPAGSEEHHYIAWPVTWYVEWLRGLRDSIEKTHTENWQEVLFEAGTFSEYCLYGIYVEEVLKPQNLNVTSVRLYDLVWNEESFDDLVCGNYEKKLLADGNSRLGLVMQSNLARSVNYYNKKIHDVWSHIS
jgi:hypothetical protein